MGAVLKLLLGYGALFLMLLMVIISFGSVQMLQGAVPDFELSGIRLFLQFIVAFFVSKFYGTFHYVGVPDFGWMSVAILGYLIFNFGIFGATKCMSLADHGSLTSVLDFTGMAVLYWIFKSEPPGKINLISISICAVGVIMTTQPSFLFSKDSGNSTQSLAYLANSGNSTQSLAYLANSGNSTQRLAYFAKSGNSAQSLAYLPNSGNSTQRIAYLENSGNSTQSLAYLANSGNSTQSLAFLANSGSSTPRIAHSTNSTEPTCSPASECSHTKADLKADTYCYFLLCTGSIGASLYIFSLGYGLSHLNLSVRLFWLSFGSFLLALPMSFYTEELTIDFIYSYRQIILILSHCTSAGFSLWLTVVVLDFLGGLRLNIGLTFAIVLELFCQYFFLNDYQPGNQNMLEVIGVCFVVIGMIVPGVFEALKGQYTGPAYFEIRDLNRS